MKYWTDRNYLFNSEKYGYLLYGGYSDSFYRLEEPLYKSVCDFMNGDQSALEDEVLEIFQKSGIVSSHTNDELALIARMNSINTKQRISHLSLTIAPTLDCNFRCFYCYEKGAEKNSSMKPEVIDKIIDMIVTYKKPRVHIVWYGGEPLMAFPVIKDICEKLKENEIESVHSMVTNGYLISEEVLDYFDTLDFNDIQITLDGSKETHNRRRPHMTDKDSFSRIMENLDLMYRHYRDREKKPKINVRVNIDDKNKDEYLPIYRAMHEKYGDFLSVYDAFVKDSNSCLSGYQCEMNQEQQYQFVKRLYNENGIWSDRLTSGFVGYHFCAALTFNSFVIGPNGDMYKCWEDVGIAENAIANIVDNKVTNNLLAAKYIVGGDPMNNELCKKCVLLYTCKGGCPRKRIFDQSEQDELCPIIKDRLDEFLEYRYEVSKQRQTSCCAAG